jgi:hypothetical protein
MAPTGIVRIANHPKIAEVLDISIATVKRDWLFAKAWLLNRLETPLRSDPH